MDFISGEWTLNHHEGLVLIVADIYIPLTCYSLKGSRDISDIPPRQHNLALRNTLTYSQTGDKLIAV
jgi:hypothetical protein